ncbi:MAG: hypothetical protein HKL98_01735, partial [Burkholderiales bacterium]|nr:hypothetical protein [Burkholderiales bacterium]
RDPPENRRTDFAGQDLLDPGTREGKSDGPARRKPPNYAGAFAGNVPSASGIWYYDSRDHLLVYRVELGEHFASPAGKRIRFRLQILPGDPSGIAGLVLSRVDSYRWF